MNKYKISLTTGLAMFAMFFGSGNLVFPLKLGMQAGDQYLLASIGLVITGIIVPFLGLFSMIIYQGDKDKYFGLLGKLAPFILSLLILSLLGPFGVVPRCILVAYGGISLLLPETNFALFSFIFCLCIIASIRKRNKFIPILGKFLAPFKIMGIVLIIVAAIYHSPKLINLSPAQNPIILGLHGGYQTMDLLAGLFFSITIIEYLRTVSSSKEEALKISFFSSIIAASLIGIIYIGFIVLGSFYAPSLAEARPEQYLAVIANLTLGKYAALILAITMFLSCLTTAASLSKLFAEFLQKDIAKEKINWNISILLTIAISYFLSLIGFQAISKLLGMILEFLYPALITLSVSSILFQYFKFKFIKQSFWLTIIFTGILKMWFYTF